MLPGQLDMFGDTDLIVRTPAPSVAPAPAIDPGKLDLAARRVAIASYLYYRHDTSMMSDSDFDQLCNQVADNWELLSPLRRFMLGSPEEIRASGYHVLMTDHAISSAHSWLRENNLSGNVNAGAPTQYKFSKEHQLHWTSIVSR
jgi:hypothetical protein